MTHAPVCIFWYNKCTFIFSEFYGSPINGVKDVMVLGMQWGVILFATLGLLYILVINKYLFSVLFPFLTLLCTTLTYFKYSANIALTPIWIGLVIVTKYREGKLPEFLGQSDCHIKLQSTQLYTIFKIQQRYIYLANYKSFLRFHDQDVL